MNRRLTLVAFLFAAVAISSVTQGIAQEHKHGESMEKSTIVVTGRAELNVKPDIAIVNVGVLANASTAAQALAENSVKMNSLFETLKTQGVEDKDIRTSNLSVQPQYSQPQPGMRGEFVPKIVGYNVTNTVTVKVRKINSLGGMLDLLIQNGANQVHGISFDVDQTEKLLDDARSQAVKDARRRAELYCEAESVKPGRIIHIQESGTSIPTPQPMMGFAMRAMSADRAMSAPIAGGETELTVRVQVVFELDPRS